MLVLIKEETGRSLGLPGQSAQANWPVSSSVIGLVSKDKNKKKMVEKT